VKQILAPAQVYTYVVGRKYPMPGIAGGGPGAPNELTLCAGTPREQVVETTAFYVPHEPGDRYEYRYGGGGGWGDPLERAPQAVLDDVLDEYVSVEGARRDYGVVLTGTLAALDLAVDRAATTALRASRRKPPMNTKDQQ
jgi:N-methylhydantoinase B